MATHCSVLAQRIPWTEKVSTFLPQRQTGLDKNGHDEWMDIGQVSATHRKH